MKIVHVVYSLEMGGAEVLVAQLCRRQRANGHEVSVCAYSRLGAVGETLRTEGFAIHVPGEAHPAVTMWRYFRHFRKLRPDVVHCHNPAPTLQAALSARLAGAASIVSTRHSLVAPPYDIAAERKYNLLANCCDWIVGICEITCENLRQVPGAHQKKIVRVYNGVAPLERSERRLTETGPTRTVFRLLFVGRLAEIKDLETLLHAVALAAKRVPELELWIVGDGPVRASLEDLARTLGVSHRVAFLGQRLETGRFFSVADLFVMSSVSEGLPMSLLQAMSFGLPAVLTDVGGMAEVLRLAQSGLLVPVKDSAAMADAIVRVAGEEALRTEFSTRALAAYTAHFTLEQMDAAYMELYRRGTGTLPIAPNPPGVTANL